MARLVPNPLGELLHPIQRLEEAVGELTEEIGAVQALPRIEERLDSVHDTMTAMLDVVRLLHEDLREFIASLDASRPVGATPVTRDRSP
jgi:hypothetical protein